ncbi:MAG: hypothetical protein HY806_03540, partial [Nitrospirae bacterium]|nr:hypothetical protein [Nitrospirota bacterium]
MNRIQGVKPACPVGRGARGQDLKIRDPLRVTRQGSRILDPVVMKQRLIELILARSFKFTKKPSFTLASGKKSNFYFNCKPTTLNSEGKYLIGNLLYEIIEKWKPAGIRAVGGLTLGADPVANAIAYTA